MRRRWFLPPADALVVFGATIQSASGRTAYDRCRVAASFKQNEVARAVRLNSCEQVANREYTEQVRQDELRKERESQDEQKQAEADKEVETQHASATGAHLIVANVYDRDDTERNRNPACFFEPTSRFELPGGPGPLPTQGSHGPGLMGSVWLWGVVLSRAGRIRRTGRFCSP